MRERAVRMVFEHCDAHGARRAAITSVAEKIGCAADTPRNCVRQAERDAGQRPGPTTGDRARLELLERERWESWSANGTLREPSACFAQAELDRRTK